MRPINSRDLANHRCLRGTARIDCACLQAIYPALINREGMFSKRARAKTSEKSARDLHAKTCCCISPLVFPPVFSAYLFAIPFPADGNKKQREEKKKEKKTKRDDAAEADREMHVRGAAVERKVVSILRNAERWNDFNNARDLRRRKTQRRLELR